MKKWLVGGLISLLVLGCASVKNDQTNLEMGDELVVLAHGLARSSFAMRDFALQLEQAGYHVCVMDYSTVGQSVDSVLALTKQQIDSCVDNTNRIHFIGHSLGGLVIRAYLQSEPEIANSTRFGEVVLMGTPNLGSEVADHFKNHMLMQWAGETSQSLMTGENTLGAQLTTPDYRVGIIAGTNTNSATKALFDGPNDGLVSVASAKLANMKDFIELDVSHSRMRSDSEVANQAIHFLKTGRFAHQ